MEIKFYTQVYMHINFELYIYIYIYRLFEMNMKYKKSFGYILMNRSHFF